MVSLCCLAALLCATPVLRAQDEKDDDAAPAKKEKAKKDKKADDDDDGGIQIPVADNAPVRGIKVPHYGPDGKLIMMFDAEEARKIDEHHIAMQNLKIDAYGDDGKKFYIELPKSVFNLETRILDGTEHVLIRREDFEITGDAGEFQTKTRFARVIGNVKMTIFSTENFNEK